MGPREHEKISAIVRNHCTECSINRFGVGTWDYHVIDRRVNGLARVGNGGAVERFDPV